MKKSWTIAIVLLLLVAVVVMIYNYNVRGTLYSPEIKEVCVLGSSERCFEVEIADDAKTRGLGLMYRESLEENAGMLFVFERPGRHGFWMKNTLIPLDIIWISENKEIVYIKENALPCPNDFCPSINPTAEALYVLEINSGLAEKLGIKVGDEVVIR